VNQKRGASVRLAADARVTGRGRHRALERHAASDFFFALAAWMSACRWEGAIERQIWALEQKKSKIWALDKKNQKRAWRASGLQLTLVHGAGALRASGLQLTLVAAGARTPKWVLERQGPEKYFFFFFFFLDKENRL
jgi:hypothetical protein